MKKFLISLSAVFFLSGADAQVNRFPDPEDETHQILTGLHFENPVEPIVKAIHLSTGVTLQYVEQGDESGIPVILIHGYSDSWRSYELVLPLLPANFHVYAITLRGHGESDKPADGYDIKDFSDDVAAFIKVKKLGPSVIVGHSMGSLVAQSLAVNHPNLVKAMVLEGAGSNFNSNDVVKKDLNGFVAQLTDPISLEFAREFQMGTIAKEVSATFMNTMIEQSMKLPARVWKAALDGFVDEDFSKKFKNFNKPSLIIWGDKDLIFPREQQNLLLKSIPGSMLLVYDGVGHCPHWELKEKYATDLTSFINAISK